MIVFENPGEIDIRAVTTLGVNVKEGASAIGYFGTGLKYAIAVLLREGCPVDVWSGGTKYQFGTELTEIRGKPFGIVSMWTGKGEKQSLGFTTDLGKNWTLPFAYRELWSNCQDEGGRVYEDKVSVMSALIGTTGGTIEEISDSFRPRAGMTHICIHGQRFAEVHDRREGTILLPQGLRLVGKRGGDLEVFERISKVVYYKGIAALELTKPSTYTYNITSAHALTEDRTLSGGTYWLEHYAREWVREDAPQGAVEDLLLAGEGYFEAELNFSYTSSAAKETLETIERLMKTAPERLNRTARDMMLRVKRNAGGRIDYVPAKLSEREEAELLQAKECVARWGYDASPYELVVTEELDNSILGLALRAQQTIVLARKTLGDPDKLRGTLIEEIVHLKFNVSDETRAMQEVLVNEIVRMGYEREKGRGE